MADVVTAAVGGSVLRVTRFLVTCDTGITLGGGSETSCKLYTFSKYLSGVARAFVEKFFRLTIAWRYKGLCQWDCFRMSSNPSPINI